MTEDIIKKINKEELINVIHGFYCGDYQLPKDATYINVQATTKLNCSPVNKSPKEAIYEAIDHIAKGDHLKINFYNNFKKFLNDYSTYISDKNGDFFKTFSPYRKFCTIYKYNTKVTQENCEGEISFIPLTYEYPIKCLNYNSDNEFKKFNHAYYEQILAEVLQMNKMVHPTGFVSTFDKKAIESYAALVSGYDNGKENIIENPEAILTKKLGKNFETYSESLKGILFHDLVMSALDELDTHRYSDKEVNCFIKAAEKENFIEAFSECEEMIFNNNHHSEIDVVENGQYLSSAWHEFNWFFLRAFDYQ